MSAPRYPGGGTPVRELSIGRADGADEYLLISVSGITVADDGSMYVADRGSGTSSAGGAGAIVRMYDSSGTFLRNIGRRGQGPGEFSVPNAIDRLPDGRVLVNDPRSQRIIVYSRAGDYLTHWLTGERGTDYTSNRLLTDTEGYTWLRILVTQTSPQLRTTPLFVRFDSSGRIVDTLGVPPAPEVPRLTLTAGRSGTERRLRLPFSPTAVVAPTRLGFFAVARSDRYTINLLRPLSPQAGVSLSRPGTPVTSIRRAGPQVDFASGEHETWERIIRTVMQRTEPGWAWNGPPLPRAKPPVQQILSGADGRLWIRIAAPGIPAPPQNPSDTLDVDDQIPFREPAVFDVYESDARYVGQVRFADQVYPLYLTGDRIWAAESDELGVQRVVRYRIQWSR